MFQFIHGFLRRKNRMKSASLPWTVRRSNRRTLSLEVLEDRTVPSGVVANFAVLQNWGNGIEAQVTLVSQQTASVPNWNLSFDLSASISSIWDGAVVSHVGNHYVIGNAGWNSTLASGGTVSFGFIASTSTSSPQPSNYLLNGLPLSGAPAPLPTLSIADAAVTEPTSGTANLNLTVTLAVASTTLVTVNYATASGTAQSGVDYTASNGTLTFAPGQTQRTISVPVLADQVIEGDETFTVNLSNAVGATMSRGQAVATVHDAPIITSSVAQFTDTSDWGSGFTGSIVVKNTGATTLTNWNLAFDFAGQISSVWNGSIVSHIGNHFVVQGASWNNTLAPGTSTTIGFNGSPGNMTVVPTNFVLSGPSSNGGGTTPSLVAVNDTASTGAGVAAVIKVLANDTDTSGTALSVTAVSQGQHGTVTINADGTVTYSPAAGYAGSDSFTYTASDKAGLTGKATVTVTVSSSTVAGWPAHVFAPYIDMTLYPTPNLVNIASTQGVKYFSLAFIVADTNAQPAWGGYSSYEVNGAAYDQQMRTAIAGLRALGGDVSVSFGGAAGQELAQKITDVTKLTAAYQTVINAYQLTHVDFDIEGAAVADHASIDRRSQALAALQQQATAAGKTLSISFTLPVLPTGLTADGLYVVQSALKYGVKISVVNVMAMDYGDSAALNPTGQMGTYAIQAATSLYNQLQTLYGSSLTSTQLWQMVGVTPMIGRNDVSTEVFDQAAAKQLLQFAQQKGIGELSMWSIARDQQDPAGALNYSTATSSSILQTPFEFSHILGAFNG